MKKVLTIARRELGSYFSGPLAYVITATVLALTGFFFLPGLERGAQDLNFWMGDVGLILVILMPALTMRLLAEERRSGSLELLLTSPVSECQIVLGKYLGSLAFFGIILLLMFQLPAAFILICKPTDLAPIFSGMLGLFLLGAFFLSVGLFFSSLTRSQAAAYFTTFALLLFVYMISWLAQPGDGFWDPLLNYVSLGRQMIDFAHGVIDTRDLVFYVSGIGLYLFLAVRSVAALR